MKVISSKILFSKTENRNNSMNIKNNNQNTLERTPLMDSLNFTGAGTVFRSEFVNKFLKGNAFDNILYSFNFAKYESYGLPLKYSRRKFVRATEAALEGLPENRQNEVLNKFGLYRGEKDLEGVPTIPTEIDNSPEFSAISKSLKQLTRKNEADTHHSQLKEMINTILEGFPEFTSIIGKKQHVTHIYSVDIHSLKLLQSCMNNPKYQKLSEDGKVVLKFTTLLHDFGKMGSVITPGHAAMSKVYAEKILKEFPLREDLKQRILLHVENHHWFENYNNGYTSAIDVCNLFKTKEDLEIAKMLAKGDFENVNPTFHLKRMVRGELITQAEFDKIFAKKTDPISI